MTANRDRSNTADKIRQRFGGSGAVLAPTSAASGVGESEIEAQSRKETEQLIGVSGNPNQKPIREVRSVYDLEPGRYQGRLRDMKRVTDPDSEEFQSLLESIKTYGFKGELLISKNDKIYSGHRRWAVLKWLHENEGWTEEVPVLIVNVPDQDELSFMTRFNATSQQLTKEAIANIVDYYHKEQGLSIRDTARKTGFSKYEVEQALVIAQLPGNVQKAIDDKRVSVKDALATLEPKPNQVQPTASGSSTSTSSSGYAPSHLTAPNDQIEQTDSVGLDDNSTQNDGRSPQSGVQGHHVEDASVQFQQIQVGDIQLKKIIRSLSSVKIGLEKLEIPFDSELLQELQNELNDIQRQVSNLASSAK